MHKSFSYSIVLILFLLIGAKVTAVPAISSLVKARQSDKTLLSYYLKGDEKVSWGKTTDGYTLLFAKNGDMVYAVSDNKGGITASEVMAHNEGKRTAEETKFIAQLSKSLFYSTDQLNTLKQYWDFRQTDYFKDALKRATKTQADLRILVLLVQYPDKPFINDSAYFANLFNQKGYSMEGNEGSINDYFNASTAGQINVSAGVYGPFTSSANYNAYGYDSTGHSGAKTLLREAINLADNQVDYSQYCNNGGDYVDCVFMIYAGYSRASGEPNAIWPHRSVLYPSVQKDGVNLYNYGCSSEMNGTSAYGSSQPTVGTICHEFSHVLGLPDLYDTDYDENGYAADAVTNWDIMSQGSYNNNGKCPPMWSAWERSSVGCLEPVELVNTTAMIGNKTLRPLEDTNMAYKLVVNNNEYFIIENRQQKSWDRFLLAHGMIVTHIDKTVSGWNSNCANCNPDRLGIRIMQAGGSFYSAPFPGNSNITSLTDSTNPSTLTNDGVAINKPLRHIAEDATTQNISFDFGAVPASAPRAFTLSVIKVVADTIIVSCSKTDGTDAVAEKGLLYSQTDMPVYATAQKIIDNSSTETYRVTLSGLTSQTTYYVRAYVKTASGAVYYGQVIKITTPCSRVIDFPYNVGFESSENLSCWSQEGKNFVENEWKYVSVGEPSGINNANEGQFFAWLYYPYASGESRFLVSPQLDISSLAQPYLRFYYALKTRSNRNDGLNIYYRTSTFASWQLLKSYSSAANTWTKDSIALPSGTDNYYIAFEGSLNGGWGVCVDNIEISEASAEAFPTVHTIGVSSITDNSVKVSGNVTSSGHTFLTQRGIVWSQTENPTITSSIVTEQASAIGQYQAYAVDMLPNTTYYVRAFAKNKSLVSYGENIVVTTKCERISSYPHLFTTNDNDVACFETEDTLWHTSVSEGGITPKEGENFYMFKPLQSATSKLVIPIMNLANQTSTMLKFYYQKPSSTNTLKVYYKIGAENSWQLMSTITGQTSAWTLDSIALNNASDNYYIAFEGAAQNGEAIYLDSIVVSAILQTPIVQTTSVALATYNSIIASGNVTYGGLVSLIAKGFCYSTTNSQPTIADNVKNSGTSLGAYTDSLTSLQSHTKYYVRAFATNSFGTSYGNVYVVTTPFMPIFNNSITGSQQLCYNSPTTAFIGSTPTGGDGTYTYMWLQSLDSLTWQNAEDTDFRVQQTYYPYRAKQSSYFKRVVYSYQVSDTSNTIFVDVFPATVAGNVFRTQDTTTVIEGVRMELRAATGTVVNWQRKKRGYEWETVLQSADSVWLTDFPTTEGLYFYRAVVKSGVCASDTSGADRTYVKTGIGLSDVETSNNAVQIYPNPSQGEINISYQSNKDFIGTLFIYDMNGKEIKRIENIVLTRQNNKINLRDLNFGHYLLVFKNENIQLQKIITINK